MRSGFAALVGRPNVGKSTLANCVLGTKVSIVAGSAQTTRFPVRAVLTRPDAQLVLVDTPGIQLPRSPLGRQLSESTTSAAAGADVVVLVIDATAPLGRGDRLAAEQAPPEAVVVINKVDVASPTEVLEQLRRASALECSAYFPVSARTGEGVDELVEHLLARLPPGPELYPAETVSDVPEPVRVAELVREQLLGVMRDELPYSIATRVIEWDWPRVRCEILVERESQKGIVIGRRGAVLKAAGTAVRRQLGAGAHLELVVKVDRDWQRHPWSVEGLVG